MASVDTGHEQNAHLVDEVRLEECTVDVAAAFEQQSANSKLLASRFTALARSTLGLTGNDVGDALVPQHGKIIFGRAFTHDTNQMIAIQIGAGPPELAGRIDRDRI